MALPPPPPPLYGESDENYRARVAAALLAAAGAAEAEQRAWRLGWEARLWDEASRVMVAEIVTAPAIKRDRPAVRTMEVRLRSLAAARGKPAPARFSLAYDLTFTICGYEGVNHFRNAAAGDRVVIFARERKLTHAAVLGAIMARDATHPDTAALFPRGALP